MPAPMAPRPITPTSLTTLLPACASCLRPRRRASFRLRHHDPDRAVELLVDDAPARRREPRPHLPRPEPEHGGAVLAHMPGLQVALDARAVGARALDAERRDVVARRDVAAAVVGASRQRDAASKWAHLGGERALLAGAAHRERGAEAHREREVVGETARPDRASGIGAAGADRVDAFGVAGGQVGEGYVAVFSTRRRR